MCGEEGVDGPVVLEVFVGRWGGFFEGPVVGCGGVAVREPDGPGGWAVGGCSGGFVASLGVGIGVVVVVVEEVAVFSDLSVV